MFFTKPLQELCQTLSGLDTGAVQSVLRSELLDAGIDPQQVTVTGAAANVAKKWLGKTGKNVGKNHGKFLGTDIAWKKQRENGRKKKRGEKRPWRNPSSPVSANFARPTTMWTPQDSIR